MRLFRLLWKLHRWVGLVFSASAILVATTGVLLLFKKRAEWIQPPTRADVAATDSVDFLPLSRLFEIVFALGHPELRSLGDVDRVDFRPEKRVYKVRSKHAGLEVQVGAVSGDVLAEAPRWSDWIEDLHDGSLLARWYHNWFLVGFGVGLTFLAASGFYLWLSPVLRRRRKRRVTPTDHAA